MSSEKKPNNVGYVTQASQGLEHRVVYLGAVPHGFGIKHLYTTEKPIVKDDMWFEADRVIKEELNTDKKYSQVFGPAHLPTGQYSKARTLNEINELSILQQNKKELGLEHAAIHGEPCEGGVYTLFCDNDEIVRRSKMDGADAYPIWTTDRLIV